MIWAIVRKRKFRLGTGCLTNSFLSNTYRGNEEQRLVSALMLSFTKQSLPTTSKFTNVSDGQCDNIYMEYNKLKGSYIMNIISSKKEDFSNFNEQRNNLQILINRRFSLSGSARSPRCSDLTSSQVMPPLLVRGPRVQQRGVNIKRQPYWLPCRVS